MQETGQRQGGLMRHTGRTLLLVVVLTLCGAAAGGWLGSQRTDEHEAEAAILISPLLGNPFTPEASGDNLVNLTTEAELVASDPVAQLVSDKMADHGARSRPGRGRPSGPGVRHDLPGLPRSET